MGHLGTAWDAPAIVWKLCSITMNPPARMRTRRTGRWLPKQPRLGADVAFFFMKTLDMTDLDCKQTEKLIPQFLKDELDNRTEKEIF